MNQTQSWLQKGLTSPSNEQYGTTIQRFGELRNREDKILEISVVNRAPYYSVEGRNSMFILEFEYISSVEERVHYISSIDTQIEWRRGMRVWDGMNSKNCCFANFLESLGKVQRIAKLAERIFGVVDGWASLKRLLEMDMLLVGKRKLQWIVRIYLRL